jgi:hypothetical protein
VKQRGWLSTGRRSTTHEVIETMATTTCPACGNELNAATRFCPQCGARVGGPATAPTITLPPVAPAPVPPTVPLTPPAGAQAEYGAPYQAPPAGAAGGRRRLLYALIGGAGCLTLILVAVVALGVLTLLGQRAAAPPPDTAPAAGGRPPAAGSAGQAQPAGTVLLEETFDDPAASDFAEDSDAASRYAFERGGYTIEVKEPETIVWARVDGAYDAARVSVDATIPAGADIAAAGLIFHYQDEDNFYLFSVSNDGYYALELLQNNEWVSLIDWTPSDAVRTAGNRLEVATRADRIALYVNGELLEETADGTFTGGEVALAVSSLKDSTAEVSFDNLLIERNE